MDTSRPSPRTKWTRLVSLLDEKDEHIRQFTKSDRCLNGIAWDEKNDRLFVTGKMWNKLYEIEVLHAPCLCLCASCELLRVSTFAQSSRISPGSGGRGRSARGGEGRAAQGLLLCLRRI